GTDDRNHLAELDGHVELPQHGQSGTAHRVALLDRTHLEERHGPSFISECLRRVETRRLARWVDGGHKANDYGYQHHKSEVERQHPEGKVRHLVDVGWHADE